MNSEVVCSNPALTTRQATSGALDFYQPTYHEHFLHWLWQNLHFNCQNLETTCGLPIEITEPGTPNHSDGPDFLDARLTIDGLEWAGDIEIHHQPGGWTQHGHHNDKNYNSVILHVVFDSHAPHTAPRRSDGTVLWQLNLSPHLEKPVQLLLKRWNNRSASLPCAEIGSFISEDAFKKQLDKAHRQYFDAKAEAQLRFYNASLPLAAAWKQMLTISLFDGLGISHNREPMQRLARELLETLPNGITPEMATAKAVSQAGFGEEPVPYRWNRKGCRPANHPEVRVKQGAGLLVRIRSMKLTAFYKQSPEISWKMLTQNPSAEPGIGKERGDILYTTSYLPALYNLGVLLAYKPIQSRAYSCWNTYRAHIPQQLVTPFEDLGLNDTGYLQKLGTVYQLKHYCRGYRCQQCEVFKNAINA